MSECYMLPNSFFASRGDPLRGSTIFYCNTSRLGHRSCVLAQRRCTRKPQSREADRLAKRENYMATLNSDSGNRLVQVANLQIVGQLVKACCAGRNKHCCPRHSKACGAILDPSGQLTVKSIRMLFMHFNNQAVTTSFSNVFHSILFKV